MSINQILIALCLVVTHFFVYRAGQDSVQVQWDKERLVQAEASAKRERELIAAKQEAEVKYAKTKRKAESDAAAASSELDRLRGALKNVRPASCPGVDDRPLVGVIEACATAITGLAADTDQIAARLAGLQGYVRDVCLKQ